MATYNLTLRDADGKVLQRWSDGKGSTLPRTCHVGPAIYLDVPTTNRIIIASLVPTAPRAAFGGLIPKPDIGKCVSPSYPLGVRFTASVTGFVVSRTVKSPTT